MEVRPPSFFGRFRSVPAASFANPVVALYVASTLLGGIIYLYFRVDVRPELERAGHWHVLGFFDLRNTSQLSDWRCCPHTGFAGDDRMPMSLPERAPRSPRSLPLLSGGASWPVTSRTTSWVLVHDVIGLVPPLCICVRDDIPDPLRGRARKGRCAIHRFSLVRCCPRGYSSSVADPAMGFLAPAIYWYGWAATAALGALTSALLPRCYPGGGRKPSGGNGYGWFPCSR